MKIKPKRNIYMFKGAVMPKNYIFGDISLISSGLVFPTVCLEDFIKYEDYNTRQTVYNKEPVVEITNNISKYIPSNKLEEFYKVFDSLSDAE